MSTTMKIIYALLGLLIVVLFCAFVMLQFAPPNRSPGNIIPATNTPLANTATPLANLPPPRAIINAPSEGYIGQDVIFDGTSSQSSSRIVAYSWDLGDGYTSNTPVVRHPYARAGTYNISLTVTDANNMNHRSMFQIHIKPRPTPSGPPKAVIDGPNTARVNEQVNFSARRSTGSNPLVSYAWSFGDGNTGNGQEISYRYQRAGTYQVRLTVTDNQGMNDTTTWGITVYAPTPEPGQPPQAFIIGPNQAGVGAVVQFSGANSTAPNGSIMDYAWEFGDGTATKGRDVSHVYYAPGVYPVTLTVTDNRGQTGRTVWNISISQPTPQPNQPPVAIISAPSQGVLGSSVNLNGGQSYDPDGYITRYEWNFGDGTSRVGETINHVYGALGTYRIILTVTDNQGATGSTTWNINIVQSNQNQPPVAIISAPGQAVVGTNVFFNGSQSYDTDGSVVAYRWTFGDGYVADGREVNHTYTVPGVYNVTLTVTDNQGATGNSVRSINISSVPVFGTPTATALPRR